MFFSRLCATVQGLWLWLAATAAAREGLGGGGLAKNRAEFYPHSARPTEPFVFGQRDNFLDGGCEGRHGRYGGPIDTEICARMFLAKKVPETFLGASDLALV